MHALKRLAIAAALAGLSLPAAAQMPPRSAVLGIGASATGTSAPVTIQDGSGRAVPIGTINPASHTFQPIGALYSVLAYGADPTGAADSAPAFAAACADHPGETFDVPPGAYLWNTAQDFTSACLFQGHGWNERQGQAGQAPVRTGTWIVVKNAGIAPITLDSAGRGGFRGFGFEQAHPAPGPGWAPTAYPPIVTLGPGAGGEVDLDDNYLWGVYDFLEQGPGSGTVGHLFLDRLRGQVFHSVANLLTSLDVVHADDWHFWPYWSSNGAVVAWQQANGNPLVLARQDGWQSDHLFFLGYNTCVTLGSKTAGANQGSATNFDVGDLYCDYAKYAVHLTGNNATAHFGKVTHLGASAAGGIIAGSQAYLDEGSGNEVAIDRLVEQGSGGSAASLTNPSAYSNLYVGSSFVTNFNQDNNVSPAFKIAANAGFSFIRLATVPNLSGNNNGGPIANANGGGVITNVWQSWTPTLFGDGTAGTASYGVQQGQFIVQGNAVTVQGSLGATMSGASGNAYIGGLPFKNNGASGVGSFGYLSNLTLDNGYTLPILTLGKGAKVIQLLEAGSGRESKQIIIDNVSGSDLTFSLNYTLF